MNWRLLCIGMLALSANVGVSLAAERRVSVEPEYGQFEQSRQIALLPQPLISTGRYLLLPGQGLLWVVETPLHSEMRIREGVLQERNSADEPWSSPVLGQSESAVLGRLMMAMLAQDQEALADYFALTQLKEEGRWGLRLVPLLPAVAERIPEIVVRGTNGPEELSWVDADGAQTHIVLRPVDDPPPVRWLESLQPQENGESD